MSAYTKGDGWAPAVTLDLNTASSTAFQEAIEKFFQWSDTQPPLGPLNMPNGWYDITPQIAEDLLRRNKFNRKPSLNTVKKYYHAMNIGDWQRTGQPILVNKDGKLEDSAHRNWAAYFGKVTFPSYLVSDVPVSPEIFAYIDDVKPRSAADALHTSGMNGLSAIIAAATKLAWRYDHHAISFLKQQPKINREITIPEILTFGKQNPKLAEVAHLLKGSYNSAVKAIGNAGVAVFFAWKVQERFGVDVLDDFLSELVSDDVDDSSPVYWLRARQAKATDPISKQLLLALVIKTFAFYVTGADKKLFGGRNGLHLRDNEDFPRIEDISMPIVQAAA